MSTEDHPDRLEQYKLLHRLEKHKVKKTLDKKLLYKHCVFHKVIYSEDWSQVIMKNVERLNHKLYSPYKITSTACPECHTREQLRGEYAY